MATIKDIARIAGVNVSTVSRALSGISGVGDETRERIVDIAHELNYTPDFSARAMVGKRTKLIGVIVPEISSNYYAQIVDYIESELTSLAYSIIIGVSSFEDKKEIQCIDMLINRKVDGIVFCGMVNNETEVHIDKLDKRCSIPFVFIEPTIKLSQYNCVLVDGDYGIDMAVKHLVGLGHRAVGFVGEDLSARYRLPPFKKALLKYGLKYDERYIRSGRERFEYGGYLRMKELLSGNEIPTAVFTSYDNIAIGAIKALREDGLKVPEEMSIVGYDNIREAAFLDVPLTTVSHPIRKMSLEGVKLLLESIEGREHNGMKLIQLEPELIIRESTRAYTKSAI